MFFVIFQIFLNTSNIFGFYRSSPAEARESQAVEGERLGKRVRKKRKIYMDSGDEEEDNQEEPEVRSICLAFLYCFLTSVANLRATSPSSVQCFAVTPEVLQYVSILIIYLFNFNLRKH